MKYLIVVLLLFVFTGCAFRYNNISDVYESIRYDAYDQAAIRLERCANFSSDSEECKKMINDLLKSGLELADALKAKEEKRRAKIDYNKRKIEIARLRNSKNPWDQLSLAIQIQNGKVEPIYPDEADTLIRKSFFGFGECAKQSKPSCMSQYAQMILYGASSLPEKEKKEAKRKALYWLNLSARFGNFEARKILISLQENIPTPDLMMEKLQKDANKIAESSIQIRAESLRKQESYNTQILQEAKQANFISSIQTFFPKTVNCTSSTIGSYTYTNCY